MFDTLRDGLAAKSMDQPDHRLNDRPGSIVGRDLIDQRAVDLHPVDRKRTQPLNARIAAPEIIDCDRRAVRPQPRNRLDDIGAAMHRQRFGDLQFKETRRRASGAHRAAQPVEEIGIIELAGADVDRKTLLDAQIVPARDGCRDGFDDPFADLDDHPGFFRAAQESGGELHALAGMDPAQQCFRGDDATVRQVDLRLIDERELPVLNGAAKLAFKLYPARDSLGEHSRKMLGTATAAFLGMVHGGVSGTHQLRECRAMFRPQRDADRRTYFGLLPIQVERFGEGEENAPTDLCRIGLVRDLRKKDGKLVPRKPTDQARFDPVFGREPFGDGAQPVRDHAKQHVTHRMTKGIVDGFEAIEIDEQQGRVVTRLHRRQHPLA